MQMFDLPFHAWANGKQVLWLGVTEPRRLSDSIEGGLSLVLNTDGTAQWIDTTDIQTDWRFDDSKNRWFDAFFPPDSGDPDTDE